MYETRFRPSVAITICEKLTAFVFIFALSFFSVLGQGTRGSIRGTVTDPNGAVVPNATVRLIDATRGAEVRTTTAGSDGTYQFLEIEPARYNIVASAANFTETRLVDVTVEPNRNLVLDIALTVAGVAGEVTVTAGVELVDRETPTLGTTVDRRRVEGLPLNGRNVLDLALLQPGVTRSEGAFGNGTGFRVNGQRGVENNVTLDGGNNNEVAVGGTIGAQPRPDAIQEFRLLTSNFEAEFGRNTGAIVNVVTKSGTNEFHGNARFFFRPTELSAARFLDKALPPAGATADTDLRRRFERKEFGFNIGGPIYFLNFGEGVPMIYKGKDRSFFFVDFERRWQNIGQTRSLPSLPTAAERNGVFSTTILDPVTGAPFPNNTIPANRISPIARFYLQFLPETTAGSAAQVSANEITENNYFTTRLDHNITQNHILNFTFNYFDSDVFSPFAFGGADVPGFGASDLRKTRNYVGRYTWVINSNLVNSFLINYSKNKQPGVAPVNRTTPAEIGFTSNFVANGEFAGPPSIVLFDRDITLGNSIQGPQRRITENIQFQDSLSWVFGDHRMKFGGDWTKYRQATDFLFVNQGILTFSAIDLVGSTNTTGDDFADFLIGNSPAAVQFGAAGIRAYRQTAAAFFAQDTWRATNNLTLSFGVRYEYNSPLTDKLNRVAFYRPGAISTLLTTGQLRTENGVPIVVPAGGRAPRGLVYVGDPDPVLGGTVPAGGIQLDKNNWAPRVGFAYALNGGKGLLRSILGENQTVIRGGIGMYYGAIIGDTALQQLSAPGFNGTNFFQFPASGTLADPFAPDPFPVFGGDQGAVPNPFAANQFTITAPLGQMSQPIDPNIETPETLQFNLTFERAFLRDYVLGLSYVGNRSHKLYVREAVNPAVGTFIPASLRPGGIPLLNTVEFGPIPNITTANSNSRRLNDDIRIALNQLTTGGNSQYDAFEANFQKRFSPDGLQFQLAYTFSKSLSDADSQRGQLDLVDRRAGWGRSEEDVPHRFVASFIYELPFFKRTSGVINRLLDGWSIGGIYSYQSGRVVSVLNPFDTDGSGGAVINFADIGSEAFQALDPRDNDRLGFNPGAFRSFSCSVPVTSVATGNTINVLGIPSAECPNGFRRGTQGRNQFRLDNPINNWDAIVTKKTRLFSESNYLELRFEAFNLLNTPQFTTINLNMTSPDFGRYTETREARVIQLGARITF